MATSLPGHALYYFPTCPFCVRVRLGLWWRGLELPLRNIHADPAHRAALVEGGGKAQVPCLRIEEADGAVRWMYESGDILRYLRERTRD